MDKNKLGFTLIEIIVVISIVMVFLGFSLPQYNNYANHSKLKSDAKKLVDVLELSKKKALSSDLFDKNCADFTGYRTSVSESVYSLKFCCASTCSTVQDYSLTNNDTIILGTGEYIFSPLMNNPVFAADTIELKNSLINKCVSISISPIGIIELNETLISC